ncbi:MAG: prefoldin subunit beta [Candidatus Caldarchaeum sp.]|uniref:Prefoldin subunit beta n=1 Tax=Caldiarchaeum subterraneum TaxID=311458 RepID=A0A7J3G5U2_CALS0|nr:prefoldin subunit beta [Candidatus Caldarchaeales archaeon]
MSDRTIPPNVQQQVLRLQQLQQSLSLLLTEKQRIESELAEVNAALEEINKMDDSAVLFKAVGPVLIQTSKEKMVAELTERKELADTRLKVIERQEARARAQIESLQKEVQKLLSGGQASEQ